MCFSWIAQRELASPLLSFDECVRVRMFYNIDEHFNLILSHYIILRRFRAGDFSLWTTVTVEYAGGKMDFFPSQIDEKKKTNMNNFEVMMMMMTMTRYQPPGTSHLANSHHPNQIIADKRCYTSDGRSNRFESNHYDENTTHASLLQLIFFWWFSFAMFKSKVR